MADKPQATDQKPYLIRAIHDWLSDNNSRVHVQVDLTHPQVQVPHHLSRAVTKKDSEVFNISMQATGHLLMGNEVITCEARFSGKLYPLTFPIDSVIAIFGPDEPVKGLGMVFQHVYWKDRQNNAPVELAIGTEPAKEEKPEEKKKPSFLKVVK